MIQGKVEPAPRPDMQAHSSGYRLVTKSVILGDLEGERLPQEGVVTAVRPEGLIIRTRAPFEAGERVFIEFPLMFPSDSPRTASIRGRVSASREEAGDSELEVRLILMPDIPVTDIAASPMSSEEAATMVEGMQNSLREAAETGMLPVVHSAHLFQEANTSETSARQGLRRRYVMAITGAVFAVLLLVWLFSPNAPLWPRSRETKGFPGRFLAWLSDEPAPEESATALGFRGAANPEAVPQPARVAPGSFVWHPGAWVHVDEPALLAAPMAGTRPPDVGPLFSPVGWVMAALHPLFPASSDGTFASPPVAFVVSEMLKPESDTSPSEKPDEITRSQPADAVAGGSGDTPASPPGNGEPGTQPSVSMDPTTGGEGPTDTASPVSSESPVKNSASTPNETSSPSQNAFKNQDFGDIPRAASEPEVPFLNSAPERVEIRIDKSDYTMTIHFDGAPIAEFPVGLGRNNATPEGDFKIASKVTDPDWSDRGRIVKAGDPENPLGKRWMGLGTGERTTSYGIHPTKEPESIGADMSRGCIRMRPEDAEKVFGLCPVGTCVCIVP
ncbi:MAG: L,D-transpeptidase family protein [Candidatus Hydrogenedentota bacterium]